MCWAYAELKEQWEYDNPLSIFRVTDDTVKSGRWIGSWVLTCSALPLFVLYTIWIWSSFFPKITNAPSASVNQIRERNIEGEQQDECLAVP